ncbi:MAG: UDP-N-acetylmuramate--alanine ligase, partial [Leptospira sp.]|nr:UDP-N-acetylmuramate--alanine ligase [Leptospira sp.]
KGKVFFWRGSKNLQEICKGYRNSDISPYSISDSSSILFETKVVLKAKKYPGSVTTNLLGNHNLLNTEAALQVCRQIDPGRYPDFITALSTFPGVKRRQDMLFRSEKTVLIEDFAHHPVAIQETIKAIRSSFPGYRLISLFEPRSATSHRNIFQKEFSQSFKGSDLVMITEVFNVDKVAKKYRLNVRKVISDMPGNSKCKGLYAKNPQDLLSGLKKILVDFKDRKVAILAMSNGSFGGIYPDLIKILQSDKER